jgi:hypothetical protein
MASLEELQKQLEEQLAASTKREQEREAAFNKEMAERSILAEAEKEKHLEEAKAKIAAREVKRLADKEAQAQADKEMLRVRLESEAALNRSLEAERLYNQKLEWLKHEIENTQYIEEQHARRDKDRRQTLAKISTTEEEHTLTMTHPGDAVVGTDGATGTELMSDHLKMLLRRAR